MVLEGGAHQIEHLLSPVLGHMNHKLSASLVLTVNELPSSEVPPATVTVKSRVIVHQGLPRLSSGLLLGVAHLGFLLVCYVLKGSHYLMLGFQILGEGVLPELQEPFPFELRSCDPSFEASMQFGIDEPLHDYSEVYLLLLECEDKGAPLFIDCLENPSVLHVFEVLLPLQVEYLLILELDELLVDAEIVAYEAKSHLLDY